MQIQLQTDWNKYVFNICFRERGFRERKRRGEMSCLWGLYSGLSLSENRSWRFSFFLMFCFSFLIFVNINFIYENGFVTINRDLEENYALKFSKHNYLGLYIFEMFARPPFFIHSFSNYWKKYYICFFFFSASIWIFDQNQTNWSETVY